MGRHSRIQPGAEVPDTSHGALETARSFVKCGSDPPVARGAGSSDEGEPGRQPSLLRAAQTAWPTAFSKPPRLRGARVSPSVSPVGFRLPVARGQRGTRGTATATPLLVAGDAAPTALDVATAHVSMSSLIAGLDRVRVAGHSLNRRPVAAPLVGEAQTAVRPRPVKSRPAPTPPPQTCCRRRPPSGGVLPSPDSATLMPN